MSDQTSWMESNSTIVNAIVSWIAYELWNNHEQTHFVHFKWFTKLHSLVAFEFCQCTSMCLWVLSVHIHVLLSLSVDIHVLMSSVSAHLHSYGLSVHFHVLMSSVSAHPWGYGSYTYQYTFMLRVLLLHIRVVMSSVNAQHCNSE